MVRLKELSVYKNLGEEILEKFEPKNGLPDLNWEFIEPFEIRVSLICHYRKDIGGFFQEVITKGLLPGKEVEIDFFFTSKADQNLIVCELGVILKNQSDFFFARQNVPFLEKEILLGATSLYHAKKILELKGLTADHKISLVQEKIAAIVKRFPMKIDYGIFNDMQKFFATSKDVFRTIRQPTEMSRIIFVFYRFRKMLSEKSVHFPLKRHVFVKVRKNYIQTPFGSKEIVSVFVGMNFPKENEVFEQKHLMSALSRFISGIEIVPDSYFISDKDGENLKVFYIEVEKDNGSSFVQEEIDTLKLNLPSEIQRRIEHLVPPIFMPRNEEEVMRNILILSNQLKYIRDIPQMIISFDEQTDSHLSFTIVFVRILHPDSISIRTLLMNLPLSHNLSIDRIKIVGSIRKKYYKEACVFRIKIPSEEFIRENYSVDLFKARLRVVWDIQNALGEVRDYNGGMILKQNENFQLLKEEIGSLADKNTLLLQNFFHSIFPTSLSTTLPLNMLKVLFFMLLKAQAEEIGTKTQFVEDHLYGMVKFTDPSLKQELFYSIEKLEIPFNQLLICNVQILEFHYLGLIYLGGDLECSNKFLNEILSVSKNV